jgi:ATP-dependent RNA helicase DDX56/DBP9
MLMSATSSSEVEQLQQLVLHNPVTLNLLAAGNAAAAAAGAAGNGDAAAAAADGAPSAAAGFGDGGAGSAAEISHFSFSCSRDDRRLVVLSLLKLGLLRKKVRGVVEADALETKELVHEL